MRTRRARTGAPRAARGGVPEALEWIAWMQIALINGAITRKLTAVGRAVSATLGVES